MTSPEVPVAGPLIVIGEARAEELLFVRSFWGLSTSSDIPAPMSPVGDVRARPGPGWHDAVSARWRSAWDAIWADYRSAEDSTVPVHSAADTDSDPPSTWGAHDSALGYSASELNRWRIELPRPTSPTSLLVPVEKEAAEAHGRGLSTVFVLPIEGEWSHIAEERFLLVSLRTVHDADTLRRHFTDFGMRSAH